MEGFSFPLTRADLFISPESVDCIAFGRDTLFYGTRFGISLSNQTHAHNDPFTRRSFLLLALLQAD